MSLLLLLACTGTSPDDTAAGCSEEPGTLCTVAGTGDAGFDGDDNPASESMFYWPMNVEVSPYGNLVVLDWNNHRVRMLRDDGTFTTLIGNFFPGDGPSDFSDLTLPGAPGDTVSLNHPTDAVWLPDGRLLLAAWHNHKLRTFDPVTDLVHVHCGRGPGFVGDDHEPASDALMNFPNSVVLDEGSGILYFVDQRNERVRELTPEYTINTLAGDGGQGYDGDGGPLGAATFAFPKAEQPEPGGAIALGPDGNLYLADTENHRIRKLDLQHDLVTTVAGDGTAGYGGDGGPATTARLSYPRDLAFGPDGRLWIADTDNHVIRVLDLDSGVIETAIGTPEVSGFSGDGGPGPDATLYRPFGVDVGEDGAVYVADTYNHRIRVLNP